MGVKGPHWKKRLKPGIPAFIFAVFPYFCIPMDKKKTTGRLLMLTLGTVLAVAIICLQVLQYQTPVKPATEQADNKHPESRMGDEVLTMPACTQSTTTAQENSSDLHLILELFPVEPDDEPVLESPSGAWTVFLEKILRVIISPNAP